MMKKWSLLIFALLLIGSGIFLYLDRPVHYPYSFPLRLLPASDLTLIQNFHFQEPLKKNWKEHVFKTRTSYKAENGILHAASQGDSSMLFQAVRVDPSDRPFLTWEWKVIQFPSNKKGKRLADKSNNDFAGRVYVLFKGRTPVATEVIQYVWDDRYAEGTSSGSPFLKNVRILVVQSGSSSEWVSEKRDILQDYQNLFGRKPHWPVTAVGVMSDSDNTHTRSEIYYRHLSIQKPQSNSPE